MEILGCVEEDVCKYFLVQMILSVIYGQNCDGVAAVLFRPCRRSSCNTQVKGTFDILGNTELAAC